MDFRREMLAVACVGAEDNSQGRHHGMRSCLPDGTGFLN